MDAICSSQDELSQGNTADVTIWDIAQVDDPIMAATIADPGATVHNVSIVGDVLFVSYYTAGFRAYDVSDPTQPAPGCTSTIRRRALARAGMAPGESIRLPRPGMFTSATCVQGCMSLR